MADSDRRGVIIIP